MQRGFLLRKPAARTTQAPNATEPKANVAQLATPQATTQESYVAQIATSIIRKSCCAQRRRPNKGNVAQLATPQATTQEGNVAQLATPRATTQESYVAQLASQVLLNNALALALISDNEAVLCACRGLDPQHARRCWNFFAQQLSWDLPASFPPGIIPTCLRPLQEWRAKEYTLRTNRETSQERTRILYPFPRRLLYAVDEDYYWNPHTSLFTAEQPA